MLLLIGIIFLLSLIYFYLRRHHGILEKLTYPMEKPFLCFGSPPFNWHQRVHHFYYAEALKRLKTKTFTRYSGSIPTVVTIDPEIIKQVTIKQFQNFQRTFNIDVPDKNLSVGVSYGLRWKTLRKELSPVFTSGKLKAMMEPVSEMVDQFVSYIEENSSPGKTIFVKNMFQGISLDVINACAYRMKTNSREDPNHHLLKLAMKILDNILLTTNWITDIFYLLIELFPGIIKYIDIFGKEHDKLIEISNSIIHQRESGNIQKKDFINVLVEMRKSNLETPNSLINNDIITAQSVVFFLAGAATTSLTLCSLMYVLATNPEVQEKLYQEILGSSEDEEEFIESKYIIAVIKETLRLYPPATLHLRFCTKDTEVEGIPFKRGMMVEMPIYASHYDPDFFPNPLEFSPERFLNDAEIIPNTYRPFGSGNRNCIAYRFAMMEIKMLTEKIVRKFKILPTSETKLDQMKGALFVIDFHDMGVEFEPRP